MRYIEYRSMYTQEYVKGYRTPFIYSWVYVLSYSVYLTYEHIIPHYYFLYTSLIILRYLNASCMKKISSESPVFLIYHFLRIEKQYMYK